MLLAVPTNEVVATWFIGLLNSNLYVPFSLIVIVPFVGSYCEPGSTVTTSVKFGFDSKLNIDVFSYL